MTRRETTTMRVPRHLKRRFNRVKAMLNVMGDDPAQYTDLDLLDEALEPWLERMEERLGIHKTEGDT